MISTPLTHAIESSPSGTHSKGIIAQQLCFGLGCLSVQNNRFAYVFSSCKERHLRSKCFALGESFQSHAVKWIRLSILIGCCNIRIRKTCSSKRLANFVRDEYVVCNNKYVLIRNRLEVANTTDSRRSIAKCDASQYVGFSII